LSKEELNPHFIEIEYQTLLKEFFDQGYESHYPNLNFETTEHTESVSKPDNSLFF